MSLTQMFDFAKVTDDKVGMGMASRYSKATAAVNDAQTTWFHTVAVKFNNPAKAMLAGQAFELHCMGLETYILSNEAGDDQWTKSNGHKADFSLTGNNKVANAYKKLFAAMKLGGDLVGSDSKVSYGNELTTVSKCEKFVTKRNAEVKKLGEEKQAVDELHQLIEEETGHKVGTPEHEEIFKERSLQLVASIDDAAKADDKDLDIYDEMGRKFAEALREVRDTGESVDVIKQMADRAVDRITGTVTKLRAALDAVAAA